MKNILCFGDSLTWGYNPENARRYPIEQRWTGILQQLLGKDYRIIEEGLNGRNTIFNNPFLPGRNSLEILPILLESHAPLDLVILFLGANDVKSYINGSAKNAAMGCGTLIQLIMSSLVSPTLSAPAILMLVPPIVTQPKEFMATLFENVSEETKKFSQYYESVAKFLNVPLLNTSEFLTCSPIDGVHLDVKNNQILAEKLLPKVKEIIN